MARAADGTNHRLLWPRNSVRAKGIQPARRLRVAYSGAARRASNCVLVGVLCRCCGAFMRFLVASIALTVAQSLLTSSVIAAPSAACASVNSGTFNVTDGGNFASSPLLSGFQPGEVLQFTVVGNFSGNTNTSPPNGCPYASKPFFFQAPNTPLIGNLTDGKNDNLFPQYTQASGNFHFGPFSYTVLNGSQQLGVGIGHSLCNPTPAPTVMISTTIKVTCLAVGSSGASLRSLQVTAAQSSGSAYAGMLQNAIGAGLSGRSTALNQPFSALVPLGSVRCPMD